MILSDLRYVLIGTIKLKIHLKFCLIAVRGIISKSCKNAHLKFLWQNTLFWKCKKIWGCLSFILETLKLKVKFIT